MPEPFLVRIVRYTMILAAAAAAPFYVLWICGGAIADIRGQGGLNAKIESEKAPE